MSAVDELIRWENARGGWRVVDRASRRVTVALLTCDGGEEMSRITAPADELETYLAGRTSSEQDWLCQRTDDPC